jgi:hypothetical protein
LNPPLARNVKIDRGFHHDRTGALLCPAGLDWANTEWVPHLNTAYPLTIPRTKEKLRSGEMVVAGDQWPIFLYSGYNYDPDDPWNGLFRSSLLIYASSHQFIRFVMILTNSTVRHTSMYLRPLAPSNRSLKPLDLATHASMG